MMVSDDVATQELARASLIGRMLACRQIKPATSDIGEMLAFEHIKCECNTPGSYFTLTTTAQNVNRKRRRRVILERDGGHGEQTTLSTILAWNAALKKQTKTRDRVTIPCLATAKSFALLETIPDVGAPNWHTTSTATWPSLLRRLSLALILPAMKQNEGIPGTTSRSNESLISAVSTYGTPNAIVQAVSPFDSCTAIDARLNQRLHTFVSGLINNATTAHDCKPSQDMLEGPPPLVQQASLPPSRPRDYRGWVCTRASWVFYTMTQAMFIVVEL